ncbi:F-box protein, partial [Acinetobacter baumannii]
NSNSSSAAAAAIPIEVLELILDWLPAADKRRVEGVCRRWRDLLQHSALWRRTALRRWRRSHIPFSPVNPCDWKILYAHRHYLHAVHRIDPVN